MAKKYTSSKSGLYSLFHKPRPYHNDIWYNSSYGRRIQNKHVWGGQSFTPGSTTSPLLHQPAVSSSHKNSHDVTTVWRNDWIPKHMRTLSQTIVHYFTTFTWAISHKGSLTANDNLASTKIMQEVALLYCCGRMFPPVLFCTSTFMSKWSLAD